MLKTNLVPMRIAMLVAMLGALVAIESMAPSADGAEAPAPGRAHGRVVAAGPIAVTLSERGEVVEVAKARGWRRAARLRTALGDCEAVGPVASRDLESGGVEFTRKIRHSRGAGECTLLESFHPAGKSIRWDIEIRGAGAPWSAPIDTVIEWPGADRAKFWTAWGDSRKGQATDWSDPLRPDAFKDQELHYGSLTFTRSDGFCLPLVTVVEDAEDVGFTVALSPEDLLLDMDLRVTAAGSLTFSRRRHRIAESPSRAAGAPLRFSLDITAHAADWRAGAGFMVRRHPAFFDPPNPLVHALAGCGAYSFHEGELDAWKFHAMAFKVNWKASYDFPHMGMFLAPVGDDEQWVNFKGVPTSIRQLREYSRRMKEMGFCVLNYFNVTEYGAYIKVPPPPRKAAADADLWRDANDFLHYRLAGAILPGPDGKPIMSWEGSVAMDPGEAVYRDFLVDQARRHVEKLPDSYGICIDRMDWLAFYNSRRDDGVSWVDGKPARSLFVSWRDIIGRLASVLHGAGKVIFVNPHVKRLELMKEVDGIYEEFTYDGFNLNLCGLLGLRKPVLGWTATSANLRPDPDAFFQRHLYLGVYPTAPFPLNDHTINPDPWAERYYLDYGPLLDSLRGKKWVLEPRCVQVVSGPAKANLFEVGGGYVVPVVLGGAARSATVKLRGLVDFPGSGAWQAEVLHPGKKSWVPLGSSGRNGEVTLVVPLERGCGVVRLSYLWMLPRARCFVGECRVEMGTWVHDAEIRVRMRAGVPGGPAPRGDWTALRPGPLEIRETTTIEAAAFKDGVLVGAPIEWTYHRLPPPAPWIEPAGGILKERVLIRMSLPAEIPGAEIRYTLDGAPPEASSTLYSSPFPLGETATVRARTLLPGAVPGPFSEARFARLPPPPPAPAVSLADIEPVSATVGWGGTARKNRSIQDRPLSIAGKEHSKGMGAHARSELVYALEPRFGRFVAVVGVDDEMKEYAGMASVTFSVAVDGKVLAESPILRVGDAWHFDVALPPGSRKLVLAAGDAGDGINADHADWADAGFVLR